MKKAFKFASIAATVTVAGLATVATVSGWGDNAGGRATYTLSLTLTLVNLATRSS